MSSGSRISAFAKKRKLNDGSTASGTGSPEPNSNEDNHSIVKQVQPGKRSSVDQPRKPKTDPIVATSTAPESNQNSFDALVVANAVDFTASREVEYLNDATVKIRLSKGQKCVLQGVAQLWIREGTVLLQGATLSESTNTYTIFGSVTDELVEIIAHTKHAELQLESIPYHDPKFPSVLNVPSGAGKIARQKSMTFELFESDRILTQVFTHESASDLYQQVLKLPLQPSLLTKVAVATGTREVQAEKVSCPRILISGKRPNMTSKVSVALINRLLTESPKSQRVKGVAFLDLDHTSPTFACPGTISLSVLDLPVLGPPSASPSRPELEAPNRLYHSHFLGYTEHLSLDAYEPSLIEKLLIHVPTAIPLVLRVGSNFGDLQQHRLVEFASLTAPSKCIYVGLSRSSALYDALQNVNGYLDGTFAQIRHSTGTSQVSSIKEYELAFQSHLCFRNFANRVPEWLSVAGFTHSANRLTLPLDNTPYGLSFIIIRGGTLRCEDLAEALEGSLVTIVAGQHHDSRMSETHQWSYTDSTIVGKESSLTRARLDIRTEQFAEICDPPEYVGLAQVEFVTEAMDFITLITNLNESVLRQRSGVGQQLGLVFEKPRTYGKPTYKAMFD